MFSFGKSKTASDSYSQGTSLATSSSASDASSFGEGGSVAGSSSSVFGADVFSRLFSGASNVAGELAGSAGDLTAGANRLFDSGISFLSELGGLAGAGPVGAGEQYLADVAGGGGDSLLSDQIDQLDKDLQTFFSESVMPGIRGDAIGVGAMGGGRQGVAEGIAGGKLLSSYAQGVLGLRGADADRRLGAATTLAGLQSNRRLAAASTGLAALPGQFDLISSGAYAGLTPFAMLGQILGDPTVLSDSFATSYDRSGSSSTSRSSSRDESQQTSTSSTHSKAWNVGIEG